LFEIRLMKLLLLTLLIPGFVFAREKNILTLPARQTVDFDRRCVATEATFTPMNMPPISGLTDVSADGRIAVGGANGGSPDETVFIWAKGMGTVEIGGLGTPSISKDGTTIAADARGADGVTTAALWEGGTTWRNLGGVPGGAPGADFRGESLSSAWGISGDGSVVVGLAWLPRFQAHAFRWEESTGMVDLGSLNEAKNSRANIVNDDGSIVAGWDEALDGFWRGALWTNGEEMLLDPLGQLGEIFDINSDGTVISGTGTPGTRNAYLWIMKDGMPEVTDLGHLPDTAPEPVGLARAVSEDGRVVVGMSGFRNLRAFIWTREMGMKRLRAYLIELGATGLEGWRLEIAQAMSVDGSVIVGHGLSPQGYIDGFVATVHFAGDSSVCP